MKIHSFLMMLVMVCMCAVSFFICTDDEDLNPQTPVPSIVTPTASVQPTECLFCSDCNGPGTQILGLLHDQLCLFDFFPEFSTSYLQGIGCDIDALWAVLEVEACEETFNTEPVIEAVNQLLSQENLEPLVNFLSKYAIILNMPLELDCDIFEDVFMYLDELKNPNSSLYNSLGQYVSVIGLTEEDIYQVVSTGIDQLDATLKLTNMLEALGVTPAGCTSEKLVWTENGCPDCVDSLWNLIGYILLEQDMASDEWADAIMAVLNDIVEPLTSDVIGMVGSLLNSMDSNGKSLVCGFIPQGPGLLYAAMYGFIEDLSFCNMNTDTGVFSILADILYNDVCLFQCTTLTESDVLALAEDLDLLWDDISTQLCSDTFDASAFTDSIAALWSAENIALVKPFIAELLSGMGSELDCPMLGTVYYYIEELSTENSPVYTETINMYASILGLSPAETYSVISGAMEELDGLLKLTSAMEALGATSIACTFNTWTQDGCQECNPVIWTALGYAIDGATEAQWDELLDDFAETLLVPLTQELVNIFADVHTLMAEDNKELLCEVAEMLPQLVSAAKVLMDSGLFSLEDFIDTNCDNPCE